MNEFNFFQNNSSESEAQRNARMQRISELVEQINDLFTASACSPVSRDLVRGKIPDFAEKYELSNRNVANLTVFAEAELVRLRAGNSELLSDSQEDEYQRKANDIALVETLLAAVQEQFHLEREAIIRAIGMGDSENFDGGYRPFNGDIF
jgi:hypothetical protein